MRRLQLLMRGLVASLIASGSAVHAQDSERAAFEAAVREGTRDALEKFLAVYPAGAYSSEAFASMLEISVAGELGFGDNDQDLY